MDWSLKVVNDQLKGNYRFALILKSNGLIDANELVAILYILNDILESIAVVFAQTVLQFRVQNWLMKKPLPLVDML